MWDDEPTPARPWSQGIQLAELAIADLEDTMHVSLVPAVSVPIVARWIQQAVRNALAPERAETDRQRQRADDAERLLEATQRELNRARNALRSA